MPQEQEQHGISFRIFTSGRLTKGEQLSLRRHPKQLSQVNVAATLLKDRLLWRWLERTTSLQMSRMLIANSSRPLNQKAKRLKLSSDKIWLTFGFELVPINLHLKPEDRLKFVHCDITMTQLEE
jgi:hypothetical protein